MESRKPIDRGIISATFNIIETIFKYIFPSRLCVNKAIGTEWVVLSVIDVGELCVCDAPTVACAAVQSHLDITRDENTPLCIEHVR